LFVEKCKTITRAPILFLLYNCGNKKKEDFVLFLKDLEFICDQNLSQANVNIMNAVIDCRSALARNANLGLIMENFIIAVKK